MKKRYIPALILPLILAVGLMSLPANSNLQLRNILAQKALIISRIFKILPISKKNNDPIQVWAQEQLQSQMQASLIAASFSPFSLTDTSGKKDFAIAHVLFRSPGRWNSSLWINKGSSDSPLIKKNSPVVSGNSLVGVIDYVGKNESCIRLITDSGLKPAVRVARNIKDPALISALNIVQEAVDDGRLKASDDEKKAFLWILQNLQKNETKNPEFLAKGILQGQGDALWKAENILLKGTGFNYDFKDQYGPSRDLRTGEVIDPNKEHQNKAATPLVQVGDLLITSGMDGIFPEGLKVATVHSILALTEGAYTYELFAIPTAKDILDLNWVTILPPQNFDSDNLPKQLDFILDQIQN